MLTLLVKAFGQDNKLRTVLPVEYPLQAFFKPQCSRLFLMLHGFSILRQS